MQTGGASKQGPGSACVGTLGSPCRLARGPAGRSFPENHMLVGYLLKCVYLCLYVFPV